MIFCLIIGILVAMVDVSLIVDLLKDKTISDSVRGWYHIAVLTVFVIFGFVAKTMYEGQPLYTTSTIMMMIEMCYSSFASFRYMQSLEEDKDFEYIDKPMNKSYSKHDYKKAV